MGRSLPGARSARGASATCSAAWWPCRAHSASDGVDLMGRLVERFGYSDTGRTYVVADPREAWVVEIVRGRRWVAQRVRMTRSWCSRQARDRRGGPGRPGELPGLARPGELRRRAGVVRSSKGEAFSFRKVYQTAAQAAPDRRQFRGQEIITGRNGKLAPSRTAPLCRQAAQEARRARRDAFSATTRELPRSSTESTQESAVFQLRGWMPREIGCIYWRTTGRPDISVLTPWYLGVTATPETYGGRAEASALLSLAHHFQPPAGTFQPDPTKAWWRFKSLAGLVDRDYARRIGAVQAAWSAQEKAASSTNNRPWRPKP